MKLASPMLILILVVAVVADAHETCQYKGYKHDPYLDWHYKITDWDKYHAHFSNEQAGIWLHCVAASYDGCKDGDDVYDWHKIQENCPPPRGQRDPNNPFIPEDQREPSTPTPPTLRYDPPITSESIDIEGVIGDCSDELAEDEVEFVMSLSRGYNRVSIPLLNPTIGCIEIEYLSDFMTALGRHASYAYGVNNDRFYYVNGGYDPDYQACGSCDENDHIRDREITPEYGWNLVMSYAVDVVVRGEPVTEYDMEIKLGRRNYGIPVQDDRLSIVTDLFDVFTNVTSFDYYDADGEKQYVYKNTVSNDTFIGGTSYFIDADSDLTVTLSGTAWTELVPTAPPIYQRRYTTATTWGAIKSKDR